MGKIKQGILGGFSGKVANVVGSSWKGIAVMKSLPLSVANPKTAKQIKYRTRFANAIAVAIVLLTQVIKPLWDRFAQKMSGFNDFIAQNVHLFENSLIPTTPADFTIANGRMDKTDIATAMGTSATNVRLTWLDDSDEGYKLEDDTPFAVIFNVVTKKVYYTADPAGRRDDLQIDVAVPSAGQTNDFYAYLAFRRADGSIVSKTSYKLVDNL